MNLATRMIALATMSVACSALSAPAHAQAGIGVLPNTTSTGTIGYNKGAVAAVQCPAGTIVRGARHYDKAMTTAVSGSARGMTVKLDLYCAGITTDGSTVSTTNSDATGAPAVEGYTYPNLGTMQNGECPTGTIAHQLGGWDRVGQSPYPWTSAVRLVCRPLILNANSWVQIDTGAALTNADAGVRETNYTHTYRGPFCSATNSNSLVSGYHRQAGGEGYDGINVYCGTFQQARHSAVMTFTDFAWSQTLGGSGWQVDLTWTGTLLDNGAGQSGAGKTPHASLAANVNLYQDINETYVLPNSGYGAAVSQRPGGIAANTYVTSGTCASGITLADQQDASCTLDVNGLPDIGVTIATPGTASPYGAYDQSQDVTVTATNYGPGATDGDDGFTLVTTLPSGWTAGATLPADCTANAARTVVTCALDPTPLSAALSPGSAGGTVSFTFPVVVNSPTVSGTYQADVALGRSVPDGDADATNDDYDTSNDTAQGPLVLVAPRAVTVIKALSPTTDTGLFDLRINGAAVASGVGNGGTGSNASVAVGSTVTVDELAGTGTALAGYTSSLSCTGVSGVSGTTSGTFTMPDADVTCTFTNVRRSADVQIIKTASPNPVLSGESVTYTIVVTNHGPADVTNAVVTDEPGAGLSCPAAGSPDVTCAATGGAQCPGGGATATVPATTLLGSGVVLPNLPGNGTDAVTLTMTCTVTASGL